MASSSSGRRSRRVGARLAHQQRQQGVERVAGGSARRRGRWRGRSRGRSARLAREDAQQVERGGVGPVQVIQQQHQRARAARRCQVARARRREDAPPGSPRARRSPSAGGGQAGSASPRGRAGEGLEPGAVGRRLAEVVAAPDQHQRALRSPPRRSSASARAVLPMPASPPMSTSEPRPASAGGEGVAQRRLLALAADERRRGRWGGRCGPVGHRRPRGVACSMQVPPSIARAPPAALPCQDEQATGEQVTGFHSTPLHAPPSSHVRTIFPAYFPIIALDQSAPQQSIRSSSARDSIVRSGR